MLAGKPTTCMRCPYGQAKPGSHRRTFTVGGDPYEIHLCADHAQRFDRDLNVWVNLADPVEPSKPPVTVAAAPRLPVVRRRHVGDDHAAQIRAARRKLAKARGPVETVEGDRDAVLVGPHDEWRFSAHAQQRARERGISTDDVLKAVTHPELTLPNRNLKYPGTFHYFRRPCSAVVNPRTKEILTVLTEIQYLCQTVNDARKVPVRHARS